MKRGKREKGEKVKQTVIKMPELGEGVTEGELVKWLVAKGDTIKIDQPVAEVMTDKAVMSAPSPVDGVVESFSAQAGDTIQVGQNLLVIQSEGGSSSPDSPSEQKTEEVANAVSRSPSQKKETPQQALQKEDVLATPLVRRLAKEKNINLNQITGTGPKGRVTKEDVLKHSSPTASSSTAEEGASSPAEEGASSPAEEKVSALKNMGFAIPTTEGVERTPLTGIRKKIADKMQAVKTVVPHFTVMLSADVEQLEKVKNSVKSMLAEQNIKVTYLSFVMKALLHTVKEYPFLNGGIDDFSKEIVTHHNYHFGFAVDTPRGLLVPVVTDVDKKPLSEVSFNIQTLAEKARAGTIALEEMSGGTITVTNIGSVGGEYATPIINAPESSILGMYQIYVKPFWDGEAFQPRKTMNFSLTCDHRLIDGAVATRALKSFIHKIENPLSLFI